MAYNTTSYESFYKGTPSALSPEYGAFGSTGYRMSAAQLGFSGSPQTANQLGETVNALKHGVKAFEVSLLGVQDADQAIPKQHFKEMRAIMKLSGVKPSVHGPVVDAAGFGEKGWGGNEARENNERKMFHAIERAHELDPKGNTPIVFHAANGTPGAEFKPGDVEKDEERFIMQKGFAINKETKQMIPLEREYKFRPEDPDELRNKGTLFTAEKQVGAASLGEWEKKISEMGEMSKHAGEIMGHTPMKLIDKGYENAGISKNGKEIIDLETNQPLPLLNEVGATGDYNQLKKAGIFLENAELSFKTAFNQAWKYGTDEQRDELEELSQDYARGAAVSFPLVKMPNKKEYTQIMSPAKRKEVLDSSMSRLIEITDINKGKTPKIYEEVESFAMNKAADTFGNLAARSYKKFGKNAPIIAVENLYQGVAFSRAEDLKELVERSRERFVDRLIDEEGLSKREAKKIAEKQVGVTWDVGHLNLLRKTGFTEEDILEQTKKITEDKSMVKHVHLTDNFGYADSHLSPGMGNVPTKKILEQLEKTGRLDEMRKIVEDAAVVQHFKVAPHKMTLAAFGSPIYGMQMGSYWNQAADVFGGYFGGYGTLNPQQHHTMYGAGFTTMPIELGGQMAGDQSRFGGAPMA
jgi:sugar phosphate isomerase/epimerase